MSPLLNRSVRTYVLAGLPLQHQDPAGFLAQSKPSLSGTGWGVVALKSRMNPDPDSIGTTVSSQPILNITSALVLCYWLLPVSSFLFCWCSVFFFPPLTNWEHFVLTYGNSPGSFSYLSLLTCVAELWGPGLLGYLPHFLSCYKLDWVCTPGFCCR